MLLPFFLYGLSAERSLNSTSNYSNAALYRFWLEGHHKQKYLVIFSYISCHWLLSFSPPLLYLSSLVPCIATALLISFPNSYPYLQQLQKTVWSTDSTSQEFPSWVSLWKSQNFVGIGVNLSFSRAPIHRPKGEGRGYDSVSWKYNIVWISSSAQVWFLTPLKAWTL